MRRVWLGIIVLVSAFPKLLHLWWPILGWDAHRQSDTAAVARNFFRSGESILYPMVDVFGGGYVEMNFPLYPYLVSLVYRVGGFHVGYGRILSILSAAATVLIMYLLIRRISNRRAAFAGAVFLAFLPAYMYFGRAFMPESLLLCCMAAGMLFFARWMDEQRVVDMLFAWVFLSLAILIKLPLYLGLPLLFLARVRYGSWSHAFRQAKLWVFAVLVLAPSALWYWHAWHLGQESGITFGIWHMPGTWRWANATILSDPAFYTTIAKSIAKYHLTFPGVLLLGAAFFLPKRNAHETLAEWWLLAFLIFILLFASGHSASTYYQLPIILPAAMLVGRSVDRLCERWGDRGSVRQRRILFTALGFAALLLLASMAHRMYRALEREENKLPMMALAQRLRVITAPSDRIATVTHGGPNLLYLSDRKGWVKYCPDINSASVKEMLARGVHVYAGMRSACPTAVDFFRSWQMQDGQWSVESDSMRFIAVYVPEDYLSER